MHRHLTLLPLLALPACQDAPLLPRSEDTAPPPRAEFVIVASPGDAARLVISMDDALTRLLAASTSDALGAAFAEMHEALAADDGGRLRSAVDRARQALEPLRGLDDGAHLADLDAVELVLDLAGQAVRRPHDFSINR